MPVLEAQLEETLAAVEGADHCLTFSSGLMKYIDIGDYSKKWHTYHRKKALFIVVPVFEAKSHTEWDEFGGNVQIVLIWSSQKSQYQYRDHLTNYLTLSFPQMWQNILQSEICNEVFGLKITF